MRSQYSKLTHEAFAADIIDYYLNVAKRDRLATAVHFVDGGRVKKRKKVYEIIRRYETRGHVKHLTNAGRKRTVETPENFQRVKELYQSNPNISVREAAHILNLSRVSTHRLIKLVKTGGTLELALANKGPARGRRQLQARNSVKTKASKSQEAQADKVTVEVEHEDLPSPTADDGLEMGMDAGVVDAFQPKTRRRQIPKRPVDGGCRRCVICYSHLDLGNSNCQLDAEGSNSRAMFILKKILHVAPSDISKLLEESSEHSPSDWVSVCDRCEHFVEEAASIQEQILLLNRRMAKCKDFIVKEMQRSCSEKACVGSRRSSRRSDKSVVVTLTNKVRELACAGVETAQVAEDNISEISEIQLESIGSDFDFQDLEDFEKLDADICEVRRRSQNPDKAPSSDLQSPPTDPKDDLEEPIEAFQGPSPPRSKLPPVICDLCGEDPKISISTHKFKRHGIVPDGFTVISCDFEGCNYKTIFAAELKTHKKRHDPDRPRPHVCQFCGKDFCDLKGLKHHENIHKNAETRPFKCNLCGSSFAVETYLFIHKRVSHKDGRMPTKGRAEPLVAMATTTTPQAKQETSTPTPVSSCPQQSSSSSSTATQPISSSDIIVQVPYLELVLCSQPPI